MAYVAALASGSNGNCYYISDGNHAILVDVGISRKQLLERMKTLGLSFEGIDAIFITHEHIDHVKGLPMILKYENIPIYATKGTQKVLGISTHILEHHKAVNIGDILVLPFLKQHDAREPISIIARANHKNIGVFTDIGTACPVVRSHIEQCHALFLETNYDDGMLHKGRYPEHLKERIRGSKGHLSNTDAAALLFEHGSEQLSHVLLSHFSKNNNDPQLAFEIIQDVLHNQKKQKNVVIIPTSRDRHTELINLHAPK